jgi:chemotaxis methyl-accepting protein methylase
MLLNYDLIVCQNVLIYFARNAVPALVSTLGARLNRGGYLLLGPGESPAACPPGLEPINVNGVRAFRRAAAC